MPGKDYRNLIAWKKAFDLALNIYEKTSHFAVEEKYGITAQIRKASCRYLRILPRVKEENPEKNFAISYTSLSDH